MFLFAKNHAPTEATEFAVAEFVLEFSEWMKKKDDSFRSQNEYLIAYRDKLFRVYDSLSVFSVPQHAAIGSGQDFAVAAMHLGRSAVDAAKVASELDLYCSGTIDTLKHEIAKVDPQEAAR
jgi:ATP-dependent protease HslVU (ClpYQ) peptidase subunit